ncbi:MAG: Activator of Hsp90 ATPase 1 family protein [Myxococcaceae bacterium]|nr:Activator of Hsp90 ATPase 1 family protein [Myxococcaceae bacterium]
MKLDLELEEVFDQPVETVWRAITDPARLARWLMQNDFEPRVGHRFTLREAPTAQWRGWMQCEVLELDPPRRMVWSWDGGMDGETTTRVTFEVRPEGRGARLVLRHQGEADATRRDALGGGWKRRIGVIRHVIGPDYARRVAFGASCERVFDAIATLDGLRGWWTPLVSGSPSTGGDVRFEFRGMDEHIVMHVERASRPSVVEWSCVEHASLDDWKGTRVLFELAPRGPGGCDLTFRHVGLTRELECFEDCELGWEHFLASIVAYVESGVGMPFTGDE